MKSFLPRFDGAGIAATIERALRAAGLDAHAPNEIEGTIQRALARIAPMPDTGEPANEASFALARPGEFVSRTFTNAAGTRRYKLYVPDHYAESMPLLVMLHGCMQDPDDFAVGTRMNELANRHGFLVAYPEQTRRANGSNCWNWFRESDQARDRGEPSLIAGITREIQSSYRVKAKQTFVAGLSAGAAMALILGVTYPDLYAGIGVHSGLPYGSAHDVPSAFAAMQRPGRALRPAASSDGIAARTILFHGDNDPTVNVCNGVRIIEQLTTWVADPGRLHARVATTQCGGRGVTVTAHRDAAENTVIEEWIIHGAGHAWSGGNPAGSFADATGPDASAEMVRFFLDQGARPL
jgi:poly(hydroxyalkanoate) depolymerase family esterase